MSDVVIVEAVRTPVGKRNGGLSTVHPADLLAAVQQAVVERSGIDPAEVGQVVGGCVSQVGEQTFNIDPHRVAHAPGCRSRSPPPPSTPSAARRSRPPTSPPASWRGGVVDVAIACGVEVMSRVPIGSSGRKDLGLGVPIPKSYFPQYEMTSQFEGAERIADKWGITREDTDGSACCSQQNAANAWAEDRFGTPDRARRRPRRRRGGQAHRHHPHRQRATRACARPRSRSWPSSSRSPAPTACTPPARRRRSPTAPPPCC